MSVFTCTQVKSWCMSNSCILYTFFILSTNVLIHRGNIPFAILQIQYGAQTVASVSQILLVNPVYFIQVYHKGKNPSCKKDAFLG